MSPDPATKKVTRRKETDVAADRAAAARERAMEAAEAGKPPKQVAVETLSRLLTTAFFFGQGILGGMSVLILILLLVSAPSPAEFLHFYSPVSRYIHGLLFWLTSFCILGAVDKLAKDQIRGWRPGSPAVSTSAVKSPAQFSPPWAYTPTTSDAKVAFAELVAAILGVFAEGAGDDAADAYDGGPDHAARTSALLADAAVLREEMTELLGPQEMTEMLGPSRSRRDPAR